MLNPQVRRAIQAVKIEQAMKKKQEHRVERTEVAPEFPK
jgi:hypothetical protein